MGIFAELWDSGSASSLAVLAVLVLVVGRSVYLLYLHPLARFPGPKLAAFSELSYVYYWLTGHYHEHVHKLHQRYGDVVRIAPNELSFNTAKSLQDIYSYLGKTAHAFHKSSFYAGLGGYSTIVMERDPVKHKETKKLLAYGFSSRELQAQEPILKRNLDRLVSLIDAQNGMREQGLSLNKILQAFVFDTIGELALGEAFGALDSGKPHPWIGTIHGAIYLMSIVQIAPRFPILWFALPFVVPWSSIWHLISFFKYQAAMTRKRLARPSNEEKKDLFSFLLREKPDNFLQVATEQWLGNQAGVLIAAGFDTTAVTATAASYYIARSPKTLERLHEELSQRFSDASEMNGTAVKQLPYLAACIEETMRIMPPITFGLPRESPGAPVDGHFVPKGTIVSTNGWSITRRPDYFFEHEKFHPERWLPAGHKYSDILFCNDLKEVSQPFSIGPRICLGKDLAYAELKLLLARLAWEYEWEIVNNTGFDWDKERKFQALWMLPQMRMRYKRIR